MTLSHLLGATALASSLLVAAPSFAQTDPTVTTLPTSAPDDSQATSADGQGSEGGEITVTGSRIRRPNLESNLPVTSISGEEFFQRGQNNIGDTLNDLPQLRSTVGQQNPGLGIGIQGLNLLDLRGLGTQRTLTLVNGRRHVPADIQNNAVSVDVNTIPNDLIERVDVVTGANSAVYGSDAIAGVVNFILKRDFDGLQIRGGAGISEYGAGGNQIISAIAGKNFNEGRGNITLAAEYAHQERVYGSDIPFFRQNNGFAVTQVDPAGLPNGSDGIPDRTFVRDIRSASIHRWGLVPITQAAGSPLCGTGIRNGSSAGLPYNCTYIFNPDGSLVPQTGSRTGTGIIGGIIGGNGQTGREETQLSVLPYQERANFNMLGHYEFSKAADVFVEAKFVRVNSNGSNSGPAFVQGGTFGDERERPRLDNPFLNGAARTTIANAVLASGFRPNLSSRTALTAADRAAIANGTFRFVNSRNLLDLGLRDEYAKRDTYRIVGGVRGEFNTDWSYELSANYGRVDQRTTVQGNIVTQRFLLAMDSGRNPSTGQIQCRSQFDPTAAVAYDPSTGDAAALAADIANCVPYNPFGAPNNTAARNYIVQDTVSRGKLQQLVLSGFVSGDLSQLFELPGGPISFSIGGEYRREDARFEADPLVQSGRTFLNALQTFDPPAFEVKEAYGELRIPLLRDLPFIHELTLNGAGRVSDYNGTTGTIYTYNGGVEWSPIRDIRFRGNYGRAVRAPNYTETGSPLGQDFAPGFQDPCRPTNIGSGSQTRAANCAADLGALLNDQNFQGLPVYSLEILSGSNPNLTAEKSDSYTLGAVFTPRFAPGLGLTVDYYNIKVKNVIVSPTAQSVVNSCYDLPDLNNQFCALIQRFRGTGDARGPNGEVPGQILDGTLNQIPLNFASRKRAGIDTELTYRTDIGATTSLSTRLLYTHVLANSNYQDPTRPNYENRLLGELGNPKDEFQFTADLTLDRVTLGYRGRYISSMFVNTYEDQNGLQGRPPENADYADILKYPSVVYHDIRLDLRVGEEGKKGMNFYVGIDNVADKEPPLGSTGTGDGSSIYSIRGRSFYAGVRARF
ncbi:TonB-dependent receptor-like protein [Sphingomonas sp. PP-CE-3A-406]|nr:TonB-dependent receptor-like protein [Sphingomonas sp. PP-CE-3A-406]